MELALADVEAGADLEAERAHAGDDRLGGADRPRGAVEGCEEAVSGGVALVAAEARELSADQRVVLCKHVAPGTVAKLRRPLGRAHDVREHQRGEHALGDLLRALPGDEALQLVDHLRPDVYPEPALAGNPYR